MNDWKPIDSAPRDGTWILGLMVLVAHDARSLTWSETMELGPNWYDAEGGGPYQPAYWLPMPDMPAIEEQL